MAAAVSISNGIRSELNFHEFGHEIESGICDAMEQGYGFVSFAGLYSDSLDMMEREVRDMPNGGSEPVRSPEFFGVREVAESLFIRVKQLRFRYPEFNNPEARWNPTQVTHRIHNPNEGMLQYVDEHDELLIARIGVTGSVGIKMSTDRREFFAAPGSILFVRAQEVRGQESPVRFMYTPNLGATAIELRMRHDDQGVADDLSS